MTDITPQGNKLPAPTNFQTQVSSRSLEDLFKADPESLSEVDLEAICVELRSQRARFEVDEQAKAMKPKLPKATKSITKEAADQLSLDDLNL